MRKKHLTAEHPFTIKTLSKLKTEENSLNLIKDIYENYKQEAYGQHYT